MTGFSRRDFVRTIGAGSAALALPPAGRTGRASAATAAPAAATALQAVVNSSGTWQITAADYGWTFSGSVGSAATGIATTTGQDALGAYTQTAFTWQSGARQGSIRTYAGSSVAVFTDTYVTAAANSGPFPTFTGYPELPHQVSHHDAFGEYQLNTFEDAGDSPWLYFDTSGNTYVLSAANHFQQAQTTTTGSGAIAAGVLSSITSIPAGFSRQTILALGNGIGTAYRTWGSALTTLAGKTLPANNAGAILGLLGYWTDHGAVYYYTYEDSLGYAGTLQAVVAEWQNKKIPMGYMQLDSWWYPKGPNADWSDLADGQYLYEADSTLFPDGLAAFQKQVGVPLVTHARWIDSSSPYRTEYTMSGNVVIDPKYWQSIMSYLGAAGVTVYEQDWLCANAQPNYNLTDPDAFFDNMAQYAAADGLAMQYCMPLPRDYMQSTRYANLTTMRVSDDRFDSTKWDNFLYDSQLAGALGVWPWCDVFMSSETNNLLLANLSAGPVGVGDGLGQENPANLFQVVRPDGVIVKPDVPAVPTDATYLAEAAGSMPAMVAATHVGHATGLTYGYVFAYARQGLVAPPQLTYQAESATLSGVVVATENAGYTGSGYADYQNNTGDYIQWTVQAPAAGTYVLEFRYANGGGAERPLDITVNGADAGTAPFAATAGWTSWAIQGVLVQLKSGANTVRATDTGASGGNIDWLGISQDAVPTPQQTYQAESATLSGVIAATENAGYTGSGYADYQNNTGDYIQWTVQTQTTGTYVLEFRYANGGTTNRPLNITVNGNDAGTVPFAPTGSWTTWTVQPVTVQLQGGTSSIRATDTGASGGNIDWLGVAQDSVQTGLSQAASFSLAALGLTGPAYVYDYFAGTGSLVAQGGSVSTSVSSGTYWVVAPVGPSGIAFLGDAGKFVSHGDQRIEHLSDSGQIAATVAFAAGEGPVTLHGYATAKPAVTASTGSVGAVAYSTATSLFSVVVTAAAGNQAVITIAP